MLLKIAPPTPAVKKIISTSKARSQHTEESFYFPLKLVASSSPKSHNQIMKRGIKQTAYEKIKANFPPLFLHPFIIQ